MSGFQIFSTTYHAIDINQRPREFNVLWQIEREDYLNDGTARRQATQECISQTITSEPAAVSIESR